MRRLGKIVNGIVVDSVVVDETLLIVGETPESLMTNLVENTHWVDLESNGQFANIGFSYDGEYFTPPQPYPSWNLGENRVWGAPKPMPEAEGHYFWEEDSEDWLWSPLSTGLG